MKNEGLGWYIFDTKSAKNNVDFPWKKGHLTEGIDCMNIEEFIEKTLTLSPKEGLFPINDVVLLLWEEKTFIVYCRSLYYKTFRDPLKLVAIFYCPGSFFCCLEHSIF